MPNGTRRPRSKSNMVETTFTISPDQWDTLTLLARRRRQSRSSLVRQAIDLLLDQMTHRGGPGRSGADSPSSTITEDGIDARRTA